MPLEEEFESWTPLRLPLVRGRFRRVAKLATSWVLDVAVARRGARSNFAAIFATAMCGARETTAAPPSRAANNPGAWGSA